MSLRQRVVGDHATDVEDGRRESTRTRDGAAAVLALQRAAGNREVAKALAARRAAEPLAAAVRRPLEAAFGSPFADVRVDRSSPGAVELGALAVTRGSEIHFAPGRYDPDSVPGRELLGHELAHVVQQRQGRVGSAAPVVVDRGLEAEADAHGARAARGEATGAAPSSPQIGEPPAAQAKFGFEFQTPNSFIADGAVTAVREKELAFEDTTKKFKVEGDEGGDETHFDVEFITHALSTVKEAETAVRGAAALASDLGGGGARAKRAKDEKFGTGAWKRDVVIDVTDPEFHAKPQASVGVTLADFPELLAENETQKMTNWVMKGVQLLGATEQWKEESWGVGVSPALTGFLAAVMYYLEAAAQKPAKEKGARDSFPTLDHEVLISDGPKAGFTLMARTDFHTMFLSLGNDDRDQFVKGVIGNADAPSPNPKFEGIIKRRLDEPMINGHYRADPDVLDVEDRARYTIENHKDEKGVEHPIVMTGPTVLDWLLSIVTGKKYKDAVAYKDKGRDMLSAPVGWGSRAKDAKDFPDSQEITSQHIYGMGAYPMDKSATGDPLAIFELRGLADNLSSVKYVNNPVPEDLSDPSLLQWWQAASAAIEKELKPGLPQPVTTKT
jgi:hypothetical protein